MIKQLTVTIEVSQNGVQCETPVKQFYMTLAVSHGGPGYILVNAENIAQAREKMFEKFGDKWSFSYNSLEDVHPYDRILLGEIE